MVSRKLLTPPWYVSFSYLDFKKHFRTSRSARNSGYFFISYFTSFTQYIPFSLLNDMSTLIPVSLSVYLIIGHFAFLMGSIVEQMPAFVMSEDSLFISEISLTAG